MESTRYLRKYPFYMPVRVRVRACCNGHGGIDEGADGITNFEFLPSENLGSRTHLVALWILTTHPFFL